jgi:hypothetical protein
MFDKTDSESRMWDRTEVKVRIKQLWRQGKDISYSAILDTHPHLLFAAVHYFPNWAHAVASCGIDYAKVRRQQVWSREKVIKQLRKYKSEGADLSYNAFEKKYSKLFHAAQYQFGSWKRALSFIDVDYKKIRKWPRRTWSKKEITSRIKALKNKGVDLSFRAMFKQGYGAVVSMAAFYYGSWRRAIEQAGLDYDKIKKRPGGPKGPRKKDMGKSSTGGYIDVCPA